MMGLGSFASSSSSSSSSSNLSPLAPPFTVERSNHNKLTLNSNLDSHFNGASDGLPFNSPWPNFHSSTARQDLLADSIRTATVSSMIPELINPPTTQNWSALNSGIKSGLEPMNPPATHLSAINPNPQRVTDSSSYNRNESPFYYPCVSWSSSSEDDAPLAPLNEDLLPNRCLFHGYGSSQIDYGQSLSGLKYNAQQVGTWSGLADGSRGTNLDSEHSFFSEEANIAGSLACRSYLNQGVYDMETLSKGKEDSALFPGRHANLIREKNIGASIIGKSHGASSAINQGLVSNGFSKEHTFSSFSKFSESNPLVPSLEPPKEPWNSHRSYTPYETRLNIFDCSTDLKSPSITKSLPSVVIKPPAALSTKSVEISSAAAFNSNDVLVSHNPVEKEPHDPLGFEANGSCLALNQLSFQIGRTDDRSFVDFSSMKDVSNKMSTNGQLNFEFKGSSSFHVSDINITKDVKSAANLSENLDHHNPAEDSPCWKGAPTHFSPFGSPEADSPHHPVKKLHEISVSDERKLAPAPTEKDHKSGAVVAEASKGQTQSSCDMAKPRNGYSFLSKPSSDANSQASQLKLPNLSEDVLLSGMKIQSTDGVVDHAVHAFIENASNRVSLDVNVLVKALNNLSELLLVHCSNDECGLEEQDHKAVDHVIDNLNACISLKVQQVPPIQKYTLPQAGHLSALDQEKNNDHFLKNIENLQGVSMKDNDLRKDHNMVQTIKKVLDENLECKEEDLPSHTLLYKNLWLEAEAELCVLSYRARFHRVKREMGISEASDVSEVPSDIKKMSSSNFSPIAPKLIHEAADSKTSNIHAHNPSLQSVVGHIDDVENSVMARFNILKRRGELNPVNMAYKEPVGVEVSGNEAQSSGVGEGSHLQHQPDDAVAMMHSHGNQKMQFPATLGAEDVEHSVMMRLNVLKSRGESDPVNAEWKVLADGAHADVSGKESPSPGGPHFQHQAGKEDEVAMESGGTRVVQNRFESYNASSDWEHVLKDEFS